MEVYTSWSSRPGGGWSIWCKSGKIAEVSYKTGKELGFTNDAETGELKFTSTKKHRVGLHPVVIRSIFGS